MKDRFSRLIVALAILLSAAALIPYVALPSQAIEWQLFSDAYEPQLDIDPTMGAPGSFFTVTGTNFEPSTTGTVVVNGTTLGMITTNVVGSLTFQLDTTGAGEGSYIVTVTAGESATVSFILDDTKPVVGTDDPGIIDFIIPAGIGLTETIYLPIVLR